MLWNADSSHAMNWLRSLSEMEKYYLHSVETGADRVALTLIVKTSEQLHKEIVKDTCSKLCRAAPSLRLCVEDREGKPWFRRTCPENLNNIAFIDEPTVDHALKHHEQMLKQEYKREGPLWHLTFIRVSQNSIEAQTLCRSYMSVLVFGFHHVITDRTSNYIIAGHFMKLLQETLKNSKKASKTVFGFTTATQSGLLLGWEELKMSLNRRAGEEEKEKTRQLLTSYPKLLELRPPGQVEKTTRVLRRQLDKTLSNKFARRCKREGISVHSGFCALLNLAYADLMANADIEKDSSKGFCINSLHAIDMRRYMWGSSKRLGAYVSVFPLKQWVDPQITVRGEFWNLAVQLHKKYCKRIANKSAFRLASSYYSLPREKAAGTGGNRPTMYFVTSNMGKIDKYFPSSVFCERLSKSTTCDIRLLDVVQSTSQSGSICMAFVSCYIFRGRLHYCIDFDSEWLADETVRNLLNTVEELAVQFAGYL